MLVFCISVGGDDTWDFTDEGEGEDAERSAGDDNCASLLLLRLLSPSLVLMAAPQGSKTLIDHPTNVLGAASMRDETVLGCLIVYCGGCVRAGSPSTYAHIAQRIAHLGASCANALYTYAYVGLSG